MQAAGYFATVKMWPENYWTCSAMVASAARTYLPRLARALKIFVVKVSNAISEADSFSNHKSMRLLTKTAAAAEFLLPDRTTLLVLLRRVKTPGGCSANDSCFKIKRRADDADFAAVDRSLTTLKHDK
jgi:hypothetical protein